LNREVPGVRIPHSPLKRFQKKPKTRKTLDFTGFLFFDKPKEIKKHQCQKRMKVRRGTFNFATHLIPLKRPYIKQFKE
jgi:hypothetical protein